MLGFTIYLRSRKFDPREFIFDILNFQYFKYLLNVGEISFKKIEMKKFLIT